VDFFLYQEEKNVDDEPVIVRTGDLEHEFKLEIGFLELEVVAYSGALKIVGYAHFGQGGRTTSKRSSDHLRRINDPKLTLSRASIYRAATGELLETVPFVVVNLDRVDVIYARDIPADADAGAEGAAAESPAAE
jgi:hypothetical protein